jgi:tetratricopeptide (TPR) repeat protein
LCEAKLGRRDEALIHAQEAVQMAPLNNDVLFKKAVVLVLCGRRTEALADIEEAIKQKKSTREIQTDEDLDSIKTMPEFQALVANKNQR